MQKIQKSYPKREQHLRTLLSINARAFLLAFLLLLAFKIELLVTNNKQSINKDNEANAPCMYFNYAVMESACYELLHLL